MVISFCVSMVYCAFSIIHLNYCQNYIYIMICQGQSKDYFKKSSLLLCILSLLRAVPLVHLVTIQ